MTNDLYGVKLKSQEQAEHPAPAANINIKMIWYSNRSHSTECV